MNWLRLILLLCAYGRTDAQDTTQSHKLRSSLEKMTLLAGENQAAGGDLHCPKNWSRFLQHCYHHRSGYISTVEQANQTCSFFYLNNSQLIYVQDPLQLLYAAHFMHANNLSQSLLEIDPNLMKDGRIAQLLSSNDSTQWPASSSLDTAEIQNPCEQIKWNVDRENSNVLLLSIESTSNGQICTLSNAKPESAYSHLCQSLLDRCENNLACGKHGRCVNGDTSFHCVCSFLYTGQFCEKYAHKDIQLIVAILVIVLSFFVIYSRPRELALETFQWFREHYHPRPPPPASPSPPTPLRDDNQDTEPRVQWPSIDAPPSPPPPQEYEFRLESNEQYLRTVFLAIFTLVFFILFFQSPTMDPVQSLQLTHNASALAPSRRYVIISIDNCIHLIASAVLVGLFSILLKLEKRNADEEDDRSGLVEPIKLLRISDRVQTTAIIVIQMFEILEVLEETMTDIDGSAQYGIFPQVFKRILFVILIAIQYYPILASLQFQNIFVRLLIVVYLLGSLIYRTWFASSSAFGLLLWIRHLRSQESFSWTFLQGSLKNSVHYAFTGYVCAELLLRLLHDSAYINWQRGKPFWEIPHRTIEQYSFRVNAEKKCIVRAAKKKSRAAVSTDQHGCGNRLRRYWNAIYPWDKTFRYTTIAVCTYTIAYLFLFHLTGLIILLYSKRSNAYIQYIEGMFKALFSIEAKEGALQKEVLVSALLTTSIYSVQLFLSIKNFRRSIDQLYDRYTADLELARKLKAREIVRKSTQYPSYLLLYLLGGYFLCFHLVLFLCTLVFRVIFTGAEPSRVGAKIGYALPILALYFLQKLVIRLFYKTFDWLDRRDYGEENAEQLAERFPQIRLNILDSLLIYLKLISCAFIGIIASIIRLVISVLVNILFMPRIDYSYLVEPLSSIDSAHESFRAFVRLEMLIVRTFVLEFSARDQVEIVSNAPIPPGEGEGEPIAEEQPTGDGVDEDTVSSLGVGETADRYLRPRSDELSDDERAVRESFLV